jgi:hypothetical protein
MRIFGIGVLPFFLRSVPLGPCAPALKDFDVFYTDEPVLGFDFTVNCDVEAQCSFTVQQGCV